MGKLGSGEVALVPLGWNRPLTDPATLTPGSLAQTQTAVPTPVAAGSNFLLSPGSVHRPFQNANKGSFNPTLPGTGNACFKSVFLSKTK